MKKLFLLILMVFLGINLANAKDIMPVRPNINQVNSIGLYQVGEDVQIYKEPNEESQILYRVRWNCDEFFPSEIGFEKFFVVFLPKKSLELAAVTDMTVDLI